MLYWHIFSFSQLSEKTYASCERTYTNYDGIWISSPVRMEGLVSEVTLGCLFTHVIWQNCYYKCQMGWWTKDSLGHTCIYCGFYCTQLNNILFYFTQFDPLWELNVQKTTQDMVGGTRNHNNFWYLSICNILIHLVLSVCLWWEFWGVGEGEAGEAVGNFFRISVNPVS